MKIVLVLVKNNSVYEMNRNTFYKLFQSEDDNSNDGKNNENKADELN